MPDEDPEAEASAVGGGALWQGGVEPIRAGDGLWRRGALAEDDDLARGGPGIHGGQGAVRERAAASG